MDIRQLKYFVVVAEEGSITNAAKRLGMQQPPLSQQIQQIEAELGVQLFDRVSRRIKLNAAGNIFLRGARKTLSAFEESMESVRRYGRGEEAEVRIGFTSSSALNQLSPIIIGMFRDKYPYVDLKIEEADSKDLISNVIDGKLDIAFVRGGLEDSDKIEKFTLDNEQIVVAIPSNHMLSKKKNLSFDDIADEPVVIYSQAGSGVFHTLENSFKIHEYKPIFVEKVTRMIAALNLVASGKGITFVPESMSMIHSNMITYRKMSNLLPTMRLYVAYNLDNSTPALARFIEVARAAAKEVSHLGGKRLAFGDQIQTSPASVRIKR